MVETSTAQRKKKEITEERSSVKFPLTKVVHTSMFFLLCSYKPEIILLPHRKSKDSPVRMVNYWLAMLKQRNPSSPKCKKCKFSAFRILYEDTGFLSPPWHGSGDFKQNKEKHGTVRVPFQLPRYSFTQYQLSLKSLHKHTWVRCSKLKNGQKLKI